MTYTPDPVQMDAAQALSTLSSLMRRYQKHQEHRDMVKHSAEEQRAEVLPPINEWEAQEVGKDEAELAALELQMRPLARLLLEHDPKHRRSVSTPNGEMSFREGSTSIEVWAQDDLMAWALNEHSNNAVVWGMVRERPAPDPVPDLTAIRDYIREGRIVVDEYGYLTLKADDGERIPIPGVRQVKAEETFTVKPR